jgi:2-C-methyl-D-erythritol 4-phosphate cytidylyltransferase
MGESLAVILPAAGRAVRFGKNKLLESLAGEAVIARSAAPFLQRSDVLRVIIATDEIPAIRDALGLLDYRVTFREGGSSRAHSVRSALAAVPEEVEWVAIHDAARPLVSGELIERTFDAARRHGAAVPALPVNLTIKHAVGPLPARVQRTVPRHQLWAMQTPQIMRRKDLERGFAQCQIPLEQVTDDVQLLELAGMPVWLVDGEERNIKITTPMDLKVAELFWSMDANAPHKCGG